MNKRDALSIVSDMIEAYEAAIDSCIDEAYDDPGDYERQMEMADGYRTKADALKTLLSMCGYAYTRKPEPEPEHKGSCNSLLELEEFAKNFSSNFSSWL